VTHSSTEIRHPVKPSGVLYFDGECGLCHAAVRFLCRRLERHHISFAPLQGETFRAELPEMADAPLPNTLLLQRPGAALLLRSDALLSILQELGGGWARLGKMLQWIPRPLRDLPYRLVAALRRWLWPKPKGLCPLLPPEQQVRFLP